MSKGTEGSENAEEEVEEDFGAVEGDAELLNTIREALSFGKGRLNNAMVCRLVIRKIFLFVILLFQSYFLIASSEKVSAI